MKKRAAIGISFQWIFAILIGTFILVGTIYGMTKLMGTEGAISSTKSSKDFSNLLNPLELGFEDKKSILLELPLKTRIRNYCYSDIGLGDQEIAFDQEIYEKYTKGSQRVAIDNLYIFSEEIIEGKKFYAISTKFEFPFHITSPISLVPEDQGYCFIDSPESFKENLTELRQPNLKFSIENCTEEDITICFNEEDCNITVNTHEKSVKRNLDEVVYYETEALLIPAIFSDKEIYECQLRRIFLRAKSLSKIYVQKNILYLDSDSEIYVQLQQFISQIENYDSSENLVEFNSIVNRLKNKNKEMEKKLW